MSRFMRPAAKSNRKPEQFDPLTGQTRVMRKKEFARNDYPLFSGAGSAAAGADGRIY